MKTWPRALGAPEGSSIGEPAGIDSFYSLEYAYGGRRYRSPFFRKIFFQGGFREYADALYERCGNLFGYVFGHGETLAVRREIFLWELEELIGELRLLGASPGRLREFLEDSASPGDPLYGRVLEMIAPPRRERTRVERAVYAFLFKVMGILCLGGVAALLLGYYWPY